jgi:integrase/recombinase XerD
MSPLESALGDYLRLRRSLGHKLCESERQLTRFVARLDAAGAETITMRHVLPFVFGDHVGDVNLDSDVNFDGVVPVRRLTAVRGFARYLAATDPRTEVPPAGLVRYRPTPRVPYLFSDADVTTVIRHARAATPFPFRAETLDTLISLLAVTGMRVGEALRLDCADIDWDDAALRIRDSKFHKGRDVPVSESTITALAAYQRRRNREPGTSRTTCLFRCLVGTPVPYHYFGVTFRSAIAASGVGAEAPSRPRIHDLRHSFAVSTLVGWYRAGLDVEALLPRLSTYLGHREPAFTYTYLTSTPELLGQAAARLEAAQTASAVRR